MKHFLILLITFCVFTFCEGYSQKKCDIDSFSIIEKRKIELFWYSLKEAVNTRNKLDLLQLCNFPFNCSFCVSNKSASRPFIRVNKKSFISKYYKIFFNKNILEIINSKKILNILIADIQEDGSCGYSFSFPIVKSNSKTEGLQGFFTIKNLSGKYKICSGWTVP